MGASCCVASRDKPENNANFVEVPAHRNIRHSPTWSFRWDNRTHIEDVMENPGHFSGNKSLNIRPIINGSTSAATEGLSSRKNYLSWDTEASATDPFTGRCLSPEVRDSSKMVGKKITASGLKTSISVPSTPLSSVQQVDSLSSMSHSQPFNLDMRKKTWRSPGYQLYRQVSDSKIPSLKSLNESSSPEGGLSPSVLSFCGNEMSTGGYHGGSSDGWSMRTFSELVASSRRERWSLDSEPFCSVTSKETKSSTLLEVASPEHEICKVCSIMLKDRSFWMGNEVAAVAVLACGHVYHADCLDRLTEESRKYDPPCPICTHGEKCAAKMFGKIELQLRNKITSRAGVDGITNSKNRSKKGLNLGSTRATSSHPFLKRHFTVRLRSQKLSTEGEPLRKKGFWTRHRRE